LVEGDKKKEKTAAKQKCLGECQGCMISIGEGYTEKQVYPVGNYKICGWCLEQLHRWGRLRVEPYGHYLFLHPDGKVSGGRVFGAPEDKEEDDE